MNSKNRWIAGLLVGGFGFASVNASAALVGYTDRTAWEAAVGGSFVEEDFSTTASGSYETTPIDVGDFTVSVSGSTFGSSWHNIGPLGSGGAASSSVNGSQQLNLSTGDVGGTTLEFDNSIYAFGANWAGVSDSRTTSFLIDGIELDIPALTGGFFGFVSDTALTTNFLTLTAGAADGFGMDDLVYSYSSSVPEPSTVALLGLGVLGLRLSRRKKA
jgi:hypothetical protein